MRTMGLYLVIEASNGLMLIWDRKTTIHIKLNPEFSVSNVAGLSPQTLSSLFIKYYIYIYRINVYDNSVLFILTGARVWSMWKLRWERKQ